MINCIIDDHLCQTLMSEINTKYVEYSKLWINFNKKHGEMIHLYENDYNHDDKSGTWFRMKTYSFKDGAIWNEVTVFGNPMKINGMDALKTEYWSTDFKSMYYYA